jgi:predicted HD phosphohydrolase
MERNDIEEGMRTALRQAAAIAAVDGEPRIRVTLCLAHDLYDAMLRMSPEDRARRIGLIDAVFGQAGVDR